MRTPLVSVIIPTYNCGEYLQKALASVLEQSGVSIEVVLVDSSTDDSCASIAKRADSRVRYMFQESRGVSSARNLGIQHAQGEFIAFQDADDEWLPEKLSLQISAFQRFPDAGLVFTDTMMFRGEEVVQDSMSKHMLKTWCQTHGSEVPGWYYGSLYAQLLINDCMNTSSVMLRRKVLEQCGTFDEQFKIGEDYDLWLRIARNHPIVYLDRVCCKYRVREDGLSGAYDVRGVRWLESHLAVREKHRRARWIPSEHRELLDHILHQRYWELGWNHFGYNRFREARKCFLEALRARPLHPKIWLYLFSSLLPIPVVESIRELRQHIKKAASTTAQPLR
jgi:glycosyltransferase involved in cell wall biosynthesis